MTTSGLQVLDDAGRERELSRMLAGMEDSVTGLEHARELLAAAQSSRHGVSRALIFGASSGRMESREASDAD